MCHMFLLNAEFSNACRFRFPMSLFDRLVFSIFVFSVTPVLTRTNRVLEVARIFTKHSKCCDKFFVLAMSVRFDFATLYTVITVHARNTLLESFTVPSAVLNEFAKKFYTKLLASAFIFTKLSTKTLLLLRLCVSFEYQGLLQNTPASFLLLFVNVENSL